MSYHRRLPRLFHHAKTVGEVPRVPTSVTGERQDIKLFGHPYYMISAQRLELTDVRGGIVGIKLPEPTVPFTVDIRILTSSVLLEEGTDYLVDKGVIWVCPGTIHQELGVLDISGAIDTWEERFRRDQM